VTTHGAAPIALEPYASVAAELEAGRAVSEVLTREGIAADRWKAAESYWKPRLDAASADADLEARTRYRALFAAKRAVALGRLERERAESGRRQPRAPDLRSLDAARAVLDAPLHAELAMLDAPEPPELERRRELSRASCEQASSLAAPSMLGAAPAPFVGLAQPPPLQAPPPAPPPVVAPPPRPASSPPTMALPPDALGPPPEPARAPRRAATLAISLDAIPGAPVPFKPIDPKAPPAPPPVQITEAPQRKLDLGATMMPDTEPAPRPATPFASPPPKQDLGATMMPDTEPAPRPATPFASPPPKQDLGATMMPDTELAPRPATPFIAPARSSTPFPAVPAAASPAPKRFAINVFASITAEIAEHPADVAAIRARYGLSEAEHRAESERWTEEFAKNDELRQRYLGIVSRYRSYLQQRKKS
jgi:hypothetical protein